MWQACGLRPLRIVKRVSAVAGAQTAPVASACLAARAVAHGFFGHEEFQAGEQAIEIAQNKSARGRCLVHGLSCFISLASGFRRAAAGAV